MAKRKFNKPLRQAVSKVSYMQPHKRKVTVKLSDLATPSLGHALQTIAHKELDMKTAWAITKLMEDRHTHLKTLESTRKVLLDKYCEKDDTGQYVTNEAKTQYKITDETSYNKDYQELTSVDIECTMLEQEMIEKIGTITPAQLMALKPFIC